MTRKLFLIPHSLLLAALASRVHMEKLSKIVFFKLHLFQEYTWKNFLKYAEKKTVLKKQKAKLADDAQVVKISF